MPASAPSSSTSSSFHSDRLRVPASTMTHPQAGASSDASPSPASTPVKQGDGMKSTPSDPSPGHDGRASEHLEETFEEAHVHPIPLVRSHILHLSALVGQLASIALQHLPLDGGNPAQQEQDGAPRVDSCAARDDPSSGSIFASAEAKVKMAAAVSDVWLALAATAALLSLRLPRSILAKMELNRRKYPVELCRGKAGKYTEYSDATGITKDHGQTTSVGSASRVTSEKNDGDDNDDDDNPCDVRVVQRLTEAIRDFAMERQWSSYHRPRNLVLALLGELGELAELVQWNGDRDQPLARDQLDKLSQELADVAIYLLRLADVCGVQVTLTVAEGM